MVAKFAALDYFVFGCLLLISALIGVYYALTGGRQKTTKEWLMADRQAQWLPVSLSLLASFMSAITLLGTPSELYISGTMYWYLSLSYFFVVPITAHVFIPIFHRLQITSAFGYIEERFGHALRILIACLYIFNMVIYLAIVLYAPALALNAVTGMSMSGSLLAVGGVCTFYTAIGGMKAVIYTDVLQTVIMLGGMLTVLIVSMIQVGGLGKVIEVSTIGKRINFSDFRTDPTVRHTAWSLAFGGIFTWLAIYGSNQSQVQRYVAVKHKSDAQKAVYLNIPGLIFLMLVCGASGLMAYTHYVFCDPLNLKEILKADQILPYLVMDIFGKVPGFPGMFVSSIFSGALSTVSSGVNALAAVTLEDILKGLYPDIEHKFSGSAITHALKLVAVVYGLLALVLAWFAGSGGQVLQAALGLFGMIGGPIMGVFILGFFIKFANHKGATFGFIVGLSLTLFIGIGAQIYKPPASQQLARFTDCTNPNFTMPSTNEEIYKKLRDNMAAHIAEPPEPDTRPYIAQTVFSISYMWYSLIGSSTVVIVGTLMSLIFSTKKTIDPSLLFQAKDMFWWDTEFSYKPSFAKEGNVEDKL